MNEEKRAEAADAVMNMLEFSKTLAAAADGLRLCLIEQGWDPMVAQQVAAQWLVARF